MTRNSRRWCGVWSVTAAGALAVLAGCDDSSPLSHAINQANLKLTALAPGGAAPTTPAYKAQVYGEVAALLSKSADGTAGEKALAQILLAQAQLGLADGPVASAAATERQALGVLTRLNSALALWRNHNAVAGAAQKFDPNPEVAEIDGANREKDTAIAEETARLAQVKSKVDALRNDAAGLLAQSKEKQAQSAQLVAQIPNETAVRGEQLLRDARAIARESDALEARAAELDAQAAQVAPQGDEIQLSIDRLNNQKALLAKAREEVAKRATWHSAQAQQARAEAEKAAQGVDTLVQELVETRERADESGGKPYEQATAAFDRAAATATGASREQPLKGNALLIKGSAQQALGDVHWSHAHGLARAAEALTHVVNAAPPLPNTARYQDVLAQMQEQQKAALEAATGAYQAAVEAYGQAGAQGDARERLDRVQQKLARIVKVTSGGTVDLLAQLGGSEGADGGSEEAAPTDDGAAPDEAGAEVAADQTTVRGTLQLLIDRANDQDIDGVFALIHAPDDATRSALDAMKQVAAPIVRLDAACREKFGEGLPAGGAGAPGAGMPGLTGMNEMTVDDFEIDEQEDTATAAFAASPQPLELVKVDEQWWLSMPIQGDPAMAGPMMAAIAGAVNDAVDQIIPDIESGAIDSPQAALDALTQKITAAMMGGGAPPPPQGGGG